MRLSCRDGPSQQEATREIPLMHTDHLSGAQICRVALPNLWTGYVPKPHLQFNWPTEVHLVKAMVFPVVIYGCESWTIKKAEGQRIDAFELWCWRRLLRVPWTARRSNQSILKEISPEYLLEGLMLKMKLQYFGHLMRRTDSSEKTWCWERLKVGGEGDNRGWGGWMASVTWVWVSLGSWWWTEKPCVLQSMGSQWVEHDWVTELNWNIFFSRNYFN